MINQKGKFDDQLIDIIEPNYVFKNKPINRFNIIENSNDNDQTNKAELPIKIIIFGLIIEICSFKKTEYLLIS